jgi:hypothetical protein
LGIASPCKNAEGYPQPGLNNTQHPQPVHCKPDATASAVRCLPDGPITIAGTAGHDKPEMPVTMPESAVTIIRNDRSRSAGIRNYPILYSRKIVGFEVHDRDDANHAAHLVKRTALAGCRHPWSQFGALAGLRIQLANGLGAPSTSRPRCRRQIRSYPRPTAMNRSQARFILRSRAPSMDN